MYIMIFFFYFSSPATFREMDGLNLKKYHIFQFSDL